ncbi:filamin-binding LIM protein 1 isoform X2 [Arapaima gigas]
MELYLLTALTICYTLLVYIQEEYHGVAWQPPAPHADCGLLDRCAARWSRAGNALLSLGGEGGEAAGKRSGSGRALSPPSTGAHTAAHGGHTRAERVPKRRVLSVAMASATPQKRMVSSVFITLASPHRATVTPQTPVGATWSSVPRDGTHSTLSQGTTQFKMPATIQPWSPTVPSTQTVHSPRQEALPSVSASGRGLTKQWGTANQEELLGSRNTTLEDVPPPPPSPPPCVETELSADIDPLLPPPPLAEPLPAPLNPVSRPSDPAVSSRRSALHEQQPTVRLSSGDPCDTCEKKEPLVSQCLREDQADAESEDVCGFCRKLVPLNEPAINALNRTYHATCFQCRQCGLPLAGQLYYNKAGIPLCEDCYQASLEQCWACGEAIKDQVMRALGRGYHPPCFVCTTCRRPIGEEKFAQGEVGEVYCLPDYYRKYAPCCSACQQLIVPAEDGKDSYTVECLGRSFHEDCYRCETCQVLLSPEPNEQGCYPLDGRVLCKPCHLALIQETHQ